MWCRITNIVSIVIKLIYKQSVAQIHKLLSIDELRPCNSSINRTRMKMCAHHLLCCSGLVFFYDEEKHLQNLSRFLSQ